VHLFCESTNEKVPRTNLKQVYTNQCIKVIWNSREFKSMYDQVGGADDWKGLGTHSNESTLQLKLKEEEET
jgi:hypothetical protein